MKIFLSLLVVIVATLVAIEFLQKDVSFSFFISIAIGLVTGILTFLALSHSKTKI